MGGSGETLILAGCADYKKQYKGISGTYKST